MKFAVMGAGAVGCYFGGMLARAGHEVTLIARPAHVAAIQTHGLRLQTQTFDEQVPLQATPSPDGVAGADVVLFCVKSTDTETAGAAIAPHLAPNALVLSLQNGVDNAPRLAEVIGRPVTPAVVYVAAGMAGPGHVQHLGASRLHAGAFARGHHHHIHRNIHTASSKRAAAPRRGIIAAFGKLAALFIHAELP